jgi:hypothetical protein
MTFTIEFERDRISITWGGPERDWYYWMLIWNKDRTFYNDDKKMNDRRWGFDRFWYDCPHVQLKLWYFTIGWSTQWTSAPSEFRSDGHQIEDGWLTLDERILSWFGKAVSTMEWARKK